MQDDKSDLNIEEDVAEFRGISMSRQPSIGAIKLNQQNLIQRVLVSLDPSNSHSKRTPADSDLYLQLRMEIQSSGTIFLIGMLMYLHLIDVLNSLLPRINMPNFCTHQNLFMN